MKNVNELRIPAYAIVDAAQGGLVQLLDNRDDARFALKLLKEKYELGNELKLVKMTALKFVR